MRFFVFKDRYEIANGGVVVDEGRITDWIVEPVGENDDLMEIKIIEAGKHPLEVMTDYIQFSDNSLIEPISIGEKTVYFGYMHTEKDLVMTVASTDLKEVEKATRNNEKWIYEDLIFKYLRDVEGVKVDGVSLETDEFLIDEEIVGEEEIKRLKNPSDYIPVVEEYLVDFVNFMIDYRQHSPEAGIEEILENYEIGGGREYEIQ